MTNKELQELLKQYPDHYIITMIHCSPHGEHIYEMLKYVNLDIDHEYLKLNIKDDGSSELIHTPLIRLDPDWGIDISKFKREE